MKIQPNELDLQTGQRKDPADVETQAPKTPARLAAWVEAGWMPFVVSRIVSRRMGIEAEGKLFVSAKSESIAFRIIQSSAESRLYRAQGQLRIGFSLVQNTCQILTALNECPILLKKDPDLEHLILSSFILSREGEIEEITLAVGGQLLAGPGQEANTL
jgi:hypothetical protein